LNHQNNYVGTSSTSNAWWPRKSFDVLANLSALHNHFDGPKKLFSDLYLTQFFKTIRVFCKIHKKNNRNYSNYKNDKYHSY